MFLGENSTQGYLISINRKVDAVLAILHEQYPLSIANCSLDLLLNCPLNSLEDFKTFCNDLKKNEELRNQFVSWKLFLSVNGIFMNG